MALSAPLAAVMTRREQTPRVTGGPGALVAAEESGLWSRQAQGSLEKSKGNHPIFVVALCHRYIEPYLIDSYSNDNILLNWNHICLHSDGRRTAAPLDSYDTISYFVLNWIYLTVP